MPLRLSQLIRFWPYDTLELIHPPKSEYPDIRFTHVPELSTESELQAHDPLVPPALRVSECLVLLAPHPLAPGPGESK